MIKLQYYNLMINRTSWRDSCIALVSSPRHLYRTLPYVAPFRHHIALASLVRYNVGMVRYDVRKGAIRVSPTRYECDTRIVPWYPINIGWCLQIYYTLKESRTVLCYGTRAFRQTAAKTWNSLPDDVRLDDKLETFRSRLKTHLYRLSYC